MEKGFFESTLMNILFQVLHWAVSAGRKFQKIEALHTYLLSIFRFAQISQVAAFLCKNEGALHSPILWFYAFVVTSV